VAQEETEGGGEGEARLILMLISSPSPDDGSVGMKMSTGEEGREGGDHCPLTSIDTGGVRVTENGG
jgi:hypothetical protein